jgi:hypothetical protein
VESRDADDRRIGLAKLALAPAGDVCALASAVSLFGIMHSPLPSGELFWPWALASPLPRQFAGAYGVLGALLWVTAMGAGRPERA